MHLRYPTDSSPSKRACAFYAAYFAVLGVVLPFLGPYLGERGLTAVGIGCVTAAFSLAKLIYSPLLGAAVDRGLWFRGLLTAHMAVSLVAAAVLDRWSDDLWWLMAVYFLIGLGYGTVLPLIEASILERAQGRAYGLLRMWGSLGFVMAASAAAMAVTGRLLTAFPIAVTVLLALLLVTCLPFESMARPPQTSPRQRLPGAVWALLGLLTLHQVAHGPYYAFFSIHLRSEGYSNAAVGGLWSLGVAAELVAFLSGPRLEIRVGLRSLLGLALLLAPVRWWLLALPPSTPILIGAQLGHAATFALVHLAGIQLVQANVPAGAVRYAQALYSGLSFGLGIVVGTALAGPFYAAIGGGGSFATAAALSVALLAAWLPLAGRLRE